MIEQKHKKRQWPGIYSPVLFYAQIFHHAIFDAKNVQDCCKFAAMEILKILLYHMGK